MVIVLFLYYDDRVRTPMEESSHLVAPSSTIYLLMTFEKVPVVFTSTCGEVALIMRLSLIENW